MRRWIDKLLLAAISAVIGLVGVVYGLVKSEINRAHDRVESVDHAQRTLLERTTSLETEHRDTNRRLDRMEKGQDQMNEKLDRIWDRVK